MTNHDTAPDTHQGVRILVADDYEINQKLAHLILQSADYYVDIVENGQQAVEAYQHNHFDLILMDIQMPLMNGYEAAKRIRNWEGGLQPLRAVDSIYEPEAGEAIGACAPEGGRNRIGNNSDPVSKIRTPSSAFKQVPIIAMTGDAVESVLETCRKKGMNDCIGKPLQKDQLLSVVQEWTIAGSNIRHNDSGISPSGRSHQTSSDTQPPLDLEKAINEFLGKKDILFGALEAFINSVRDRIATIRQACAVKDHEAIAAAAHGIKGGAANLTANRLADLASELEEAASTAIPEKVSGMVDEIEEQFLQLEKFSHQNCILPTVMEENEKF